MVGQRKGERDSPDSRSASVKSEPKETTKTWTAFHSRWNSASRARAEFVTAADAP
jgi:hypothetical protein